MYNFVAKLRLELDGEGLSENTQMSAQDKIKARNEIQQRRRTVEVVVQDIEGISSFFTQVVWPLLLK